MGNLNLTSDNYNYNDNGDTAYVNVEGGNGAYDDYAALGGNGGYAGLSAGAVSVDSSYIDVLGGDAGSGYGQAGQTEGSGGTASAFLNGLTMTSYGYWNDGNSTASSFNVEGGTGAND